MRSELFHDLPYDEGTHILHSSVCRYAGLDILAESWIWDGIKGKSIVLFLSQVGSRSDKHVVDLVRQITDIESDYNVTRSTSGHLFINHDFASF